MKVNIIKDLNEINKQIDLIGKRTNTLQKQIHQVACSLLVHSCEHGDIRPLKQLIAKLERSAVKVNALNKWIEKHCPVKFVEQEEGGYEMKFDKSRKDKCVLSDAMNEPFWSIKSSEGEEYQPLDVERTLAMLIKKLERDEKLGDNVNHTQAKNVLGKLANQYRKEDTNLKGIDTDANGEHVAVA